MSEAPAPTGRPSSFSQEIADRICDLIATTPRGLDFICESNDGLPSAATVHRWLNAQPTFCENYLRARERQADLIFDECLEIADDASVDSAEVEEVLEDQPHGGSLQRSRKDNPVGVQRAKLRIDTRMRMAGKLAPKKYGDKLEANLAVPGGLTINVKRFTPEPDKPSGD